MRDAHAGRDRGLGAGERRVRVAVDEHPVRPLGGGGRRDAGPHHFRVGRVQVEPVGRVRQLELREEDVGELAVPVLAGVQDGLLDACVAQRHRHRPRLDELRPVADHRENAHAGEATMAAASGR